MKAAVLCLAVASALLAGCRREEPAYEPMKLGAMSQQQSIDR